MEGCYGNATEQTMILSNKWKYIFVHIPKTGGTSVEQAFSEFDDFKDVYSAEITGRQEDRSLKHATLQWISDNYPVEYERYYKWSIVRNPFDLLVSGYWYLESVPKL